MYNNLIMSLDLNELLENWPHEPGQIKVRKITGRNGKEKIQLRLDLGLIQMEVVGRPDGVQPHGCESLLNWHQGRARSAARQNRPYFLTPEDCTELQAEGVQYYHRYLSFFQLDDYEGVIKDTQRNLDLFEFVQEHVEREEIAWAFIQFVPYVTMMNTRAKAAIALEKGRLDAALKEIERGKSSIIQFLLENAQGEESIERSNELMFLDEWKEELTEKRPVSKRERLELEMEKAIQLEAYERAAEIRDAIRTMKEKSEAAAKRRRVTASSNKKALSAKTKTGSKKS